MQTCDVMFNAVSRYLHDIAHVTGSTDVFLKNVTIPDVIHLCMDFLSSVDES